MAVIWPVSQPEDRFAITPGRLWDPVARDEVAGVLQRNLSDQAGERGRVLAESTEVAARCLPPVEGQPATRTGLVVGYVQAGKTLSFTAVTALARDNGFQLVILIAGTNEILLRQTRDRLRDDLALTRPAAYRTWYHITVDDNKGALLQPQVLANRIGTRLAAWWDKSDPTRDRPTILVTVLKQYLNLRILSTALSQLKLDRVTALVIDDEADQASLNTRVRQNSESATYSHILAVRKALPRHTFLQYTATPQAPLLLNLTDALSPEFTCVLDPGKDYVGGRDLFSPESRHALELEADIGGDGVAPPPGLVESLQCFLLGAVAARSDDISLEHVSMLVHPSVRREPQNEMEDRINRIRQEWVRILEDPTDPDYPLLLGEFENAHRELSRTGDLPSLAELIPRVPGLIQACEVRVLNSDNEAREVPWNDAYAWILIGGKMLDRGFTVKGLTVTYMSRPIGEGNADTLWQRARFLGYRRHYLRFIRVFADAGVLEGFRSYTQHEAHMRAQLFEIASSGRSLKEWRRHFLLSPNLRPTRRQVLAILPKNYSFAGKWWSQGRPDVGASVAAENWKLIEELKTDLPFADDAGHARRTDEEVHLVADLPLRSLFERLLARYAVLHEDDATGFFGLVSVLDWLTEDEDYADAQSVVYLMRRGRTRKRTIGGRGEVNIFQGRNPKVGAVIYPGDQHIHDEELTTVQVSRLDVFEEGERGETKVAESVPALGIWLPRRYAADMVVASR